MWLVVFLVLYNLCNEVFGQSDMTDGPIIGILTTPVTEKFRSVCNNYTEVIEGKNAHFIEGGGGRLFPISFKWSEERIHEELLKVNGIFLPDSDINILNYTQTVSTLIEFAKAFNDKGVYFPIWATARGFELLMTVESNNELLIELCNDCRDYTENLVYTATKGKLFEMLSNEQKRALEKDNVVYFDHEYSITETKFEANFDLNMKYDVVAYTKRNKDNELIVAAVQAKHYPFYGVQYNPGSWNYEWNKSKVVKTIDTMLLGHSFSNFFVNECKKNGHKFNSYIDELASIIERYPYIYSKQHGHLYLFK